NIIFELELLGGADDLCAERYLLPLQSGRMALQPRIIPGEAGYPQAAACLQEAEEANKVKNTGYELAIKGALLRFLSILIGQYGTPLPADTTDTRRLKTVLQLIEAEYATPLRIEDAAEACGCSQSHFMRWFKKMTGQGFTAYLNDHRLNLAAELLRITDATVLDIAGRVGFDNLSYFNRLFKRRYGMTPREYRSK
ncbi:MAG TPA: AraC family transcriptional regulator, partial [Ruminococcaceae bacterium]|nr:AraC family transcriptional regulator [Oscillospiraceae bacterium]